MRESDDEIAALQRLLDVSVAGGNEHLRDIMTPERLLSAEQLVRVLAGMQVLVVATVTADGRPLTSCVDGHFVHGRWVFTTSALATKARHLAARPAVSATHARGDTFGVARPLGEGDVLVVAPYNAQVSLLRAELDRAGYADVRVGTVDKFQGQEAPVVIVSMTASSPTDVPRGMDFLLSRNRVNVAVSRAQWAAVVVMSPRLTDYLPNTPFTLAELGAFLRLTGG